jgi:hypothetical protein
MVSLEKYSLLLSVRQAKDLTRLVSEEKDNLPDVFASVAKRYTDMPHAVKNIGLLAFKSTFKEELDAFVVRSNQKRAALGIATIIFDQKVQHKAMGERRGHDLDYWLYRDATEDEHIGTARALIAKSAQAHLRSARVKPDPPTPQIKNIVNNAIATTVMGENYNRGLHVFMEPVGQPDRLIPLVYPDQDTYDVSRVGKVVQLYSYQGSSLQDYKA